MRKGIMALLFLGLCPLLAAQQAMNNDAIVKLVKAGLSDDVIVATINSSAGSYDTSADALVNLKTSGVDDKVIKAILAKTTPPPPAVHSPAEPAAPAPASASAPASSGADTATVHIYRYKQYEGSALHPSIYCDDLANGRLSGGRYIDIKVKPGEHTFYADDKQAGAVINAEAGREYYLRAEVQVGFWKGHFRLTMMLPEQGKYDLIKMKPSEEK